MTSRTPAGQREKKQVVLLLLLCLLPLSVAAFIERRNAPLARYTDKVPLGGSGFVRLHTESLGSGPDRFWSIEVTGMRPPLQMHAQAPDGWRVEFVEELPPHKGAPSLGVKVTAPHHARQAVGADGFVSWRHDRDGAPLLYTGSFRVVPGSCPTPHA